MFDRHFAHWPPGQPKTLELPRETVYANLVASAAKHPERAAIDYYGRRISYRALKREVDALAGFLQQRCAVARGERVLLYLQNSPQFVIGYYAILRADAVVVPVNPMNRAAELAHYIADSQARIAIAGNDVDKVTFEHESVAFAGFDARRQMERLRVRPHAAGRLCPHRPVVPRQRLRPMRLHACRERVVGMDRPGLPHDAAAYETMVEVANLAEVVEDAGACLRPMECSAEGLLGNPVRAGSCVGGRGRPQDDQRRQGVDESHGSVPFVGGRRRRRLQERRSWSALSRIRGPVPEV